MYLTKTPNFIKPLLADLIWSISTSEKKLFLTFDDGPSPQITDWVLDLLKEYNAKATFFCLGKNVVNNPDIFQRILNEEHTVGNHTYNHLNGWKTSSKAYLADVKLCADVFQTNMFRPPYGKASRLQIKALKQYYSIVMWDVLSGDFDKSVSPKKCVENVVNNASAGSIIVMHDSLKAEENLRGSLPQILAHFTRGGYQFEALKIDSIIKNG